jgi:hypothetical protein
MRSFFGKPPSSPLEDLDERLDRVLSELRYRYIPPRKKRLLKFLAKKLLQQNSTIPEIRKVLRTYKTSIFPGHQLDKTPQKVKEKIQKYTGWRSSQSGTEKLVMDGFTERFLKQQQLLERTKKGLRSKGTSYRGSSSSSSPLSMERKGRGLLKMQQDQPSLMRSGNNGSGGGKSTAWATDVEQLFTLPLYKTDLDAFHRRTLQILQENYYDQDILKQIQARALKQFSNTSRGREGEGGGRLKLRQHSSKTSRGGGGGGYSV